MQDPWRAHASCPDFNAWQAPCEHSNRREWPLLGKFTTKRTYNALWRNGYHTPESVVSAPDDELLDLRNFGEGCLRETRRLYPFWSQTVRDGPPVFEDRPSMGALAAEVFILKISLETVLRRVDALLASIRDEQETEVEA